MKYVRGPEQGPHGRRRDARDQHRAGVKANEGRDRQRREAIEPAAQGDGRSEKKDEA